MTPASRLYVEEVRRIVFHQRQASMLDYMRALPLGTRSTRAELVEAVWGSDCPNPNRLDQLILSINRKRPGLIICDRGFGWMLDPVARFGEYSSGLVETT